MEQTLILDRYRPLEDLGEGAFGVVTLAWDTRMQRRVAIKRLELPQSARGHGVAGLSEARTAAMLNHPNIVTVFDFDTDADEAFLVMEYVDGASLAEILGQVDTLEPDETSAVLDDVTGALAFAHQNGVLHLDVKPENILITREGRAKVADFGISELSSMSGHGPASAGTYGYMPLEQVSGGAVSDQTDQWGLASVVLEALSATNPFFATDPDAAATRLTHIETLDLPLDEHVRTEAEDVLLTALSTYPQDRFPSVEAFADALAPLLGDPRAGRTSLAEIVEEIAGEEAASQEAPAALGLWDRAGGRAGRALVGLAGAAEAAWLAWAGLTPLRLETPALAAAVALIALGGFLAPSLGVALGLACLSIGLVAEGAWAAAVIVPVVAGAWWWFLARRSNGAAVLPLSAPLFGAVRLPFAHPLICGFALPPLRAAATALVGGVVFLVAASASAQAPPFTFVRLDYIADIWSRLAYAGVSATATSPAAYVALLGWPVSAVVMSVFSARATRSGALVGAFGGSVVIAGAYMLAERVARITGTAQGYESPEFAAVLAASLILVTFVIVLGAPVRGEEEEPIFSRGADDKDY